MREACIGRAGKVARIGDTRVISGGLLRGMNCQEPLPQPLLGDCRLMTHSSGLGLQLAPKVRHVFMPFYYGMVFLSRARTSLLDPLSREQMENIAPMAGGARDAAPQTLLSRYHDPSYFLMIGVGNNLYELLSGSGRPVNPRRGGGNRPRSDLHATIASR